MSSSKATEIQKGSYTIKKSPAKLFLWETHLNAFKVSQILTWSLWLLHLIVLFSLACKIQRDGPDVPWQVWIALLSELFLNIPEALTACTIILALFSGKAAQPRPDYRLCGHAAPSVDIMITCCGESVNIIINTILAAAAQDYPARQFRIFILDDGHDAELRHAVDMLQLRRNRAASPPIIYLSRTVTPGEQSNFKSGNLRFGIEESQRLGPGSELLAGLDADMIPEPDWLRRMVPHLLLQDDVAIACGPQRYYNVPASDPLGQQADFDIYFTVQEVLNDCLGAPMCTGTGYVARRSAIAQIGGWPLAYAGEDYMCSALLTGAGWGVVFVRAPLQIGLAPESLTALVKQRMRWTLMSADWLAKTDAGLEVHQRLGAYIVPTALTAYMKLSVKAVNMIYVIRDYSPLTTVLAMALLPLVLIPTTNADDVFSSIAVKHEAYLIWAQRLFLAAHLARNFHGYFMYRHVGLSRVANIHSQELWSAPYSAHRCLLSLLSLTPLPQKINPPDFSVCGATASTTNERSKQHRANMVSRLLRIDILLYSLFTIYAFVPLFSRLYLSHSRAHPPFPFPSLLLKLLAFVFGVSKPVLYMIQPPTAPAWDELVIEDESGVKRHRGEMGSGCHDHDDGDDDEDKEDEAEDSAIEAISAKTSAYIS